MIILHNSKFYNMALLGQIAATSTGVINLDFVPEKLNVVDAVTGVTVFSTVTQLSLVQSGRQLANLTGTRIAAMARIQKYIAGAAQLLAEWLELALGRVNGSSTLTITHSNANAVLVYGVSSGFSPVLTNYVETSINANANQSFEGFDALVLSTPANIDRVNITFESGFNDDFTVPELKSLVGSSQNTDAAGLLNGNILLPNLGAGTPAGIRTAIVFVNGSGACVVGVKRYV
jgi:hypothetical protein